MTDELSRLDRSTLRLWQGANLVGWSLLALLVALVVHLGVAGLFRGTALDIMGHPPLQLLAALGLALVVGLAVGGIVGARVWRRQARTAGAVSALYTALALTRLRGLLGWPTEVTRTVRHGRGVGGPRDPGAVPVETTAVSIGSADLPLQLAFGAVTALSIVVAVLWARRVAGRGGA